MAASPSPPASPPPWLAYLLGGIAGWIDALGFLTLHHLFIAHMSGNSVFLGTFLGTGNAAAAWPHAAAILIFVAGIALGTGWLAAKPQALPAILLIEAGLLAAFGLSLAAGPWAPNQPAYFAVAALPLLAMGLQNATVRKIGDLPVHTTYVTGVLNTAAEEGARAVMWFAAKIRQPGYRRTRRALLAACRRPEARHSASAFCLWVIYAAGAVAGAYAWTRVAAWAAAPPAACLLILGATPIAALRKNR